MPYVKWSAGKHHDRRSVRRLTLWLAGGGTHYHCGDKSIQLNAAILDKTQQPLHRGPSAAVLGRASQGSLPLQLKTVTPKTMADQYLCNTETAWLLTWQRRYRLFHTHWVCLLVCSLFHSRYTSVRWWTTDIPKGDQSDVNLLYGSIPEQEYSCFRLNFQDWDQWESTPAVLYYRNPNLKHLSDLFVVTAQRPSDCSDLKCPYKGLNSKLNEIMTAVIQWFSSVWSACELFMDERWRVSCTDGWEVGGRGALFVLVAQS